MEIVIRATVIFWLLWLLLRAAGKRELAELTPFELIVLVVMGDLIQQGVTQEDMSLTGAGLAVATMMLWGLGLSYAAFRWSRARRILESLPAIVVSGGKIDQRMLRLQRLNDDEVLEAARTNGIRDLADVQYAILEADGKLSFIPYEDGAAGAQQGDDGPGIAG